ncbi:MAG: fatty acid desaturase [Armatimonadetes bacterium]|nr:fatty acid desaturase [Armatimonadota bacterium]
MSQTPSEAQVRAEVAEGIEEDIAGLARLDDSRRMAEIGFFLGAWAAGLAMIALAEREQVVGPLVPGVLLVALALNAFLLLGHEGMHGTLLRGWRRNRWFAVLLGATTLVSFTAYRVLHHRHHRYLGDSRDPDDYHNYTENSRLIWLLHYVRLLLGAPLYLLLIPVFGWKYAGRRDRQAIAAEYALMGGLYAWLAWTVPAGMLLKGWLVPLALTGFFTNLRGFTQHGLVDTSDAYLASRSIHPAPLVRFLMLNENYHLEHHLFPEVPSYRLGELHRLIWKRLPRAVVNRSYSEVFVRLVQATPRLDESPVGIVHPRDEVNP